MQIEAISKTTPSSNENPWQQLADLYDQILLLQDDMLKNPQNTLKDLQKMIGLAEQMVAISSQMPTPPSAPHFHQDFQGLLKYLKELKFDMVNDTTHSPDTIKHEIDICCELSNIFHDLFQGS